MEPLLAEVVQLTTVGALAVAEPVAEEEAGTGVVLVAGIGGKLLAGAEEEAGEGN